jgi:prephenate dehydrogenase
LKKLVIFGVGLIGGSIALALRKHTAGLCIVGLGRSGESMQDALELGVIDAVETDVAHALLDADMVIIATPVAQIPNVFKAVTPYLQPKTIVTDVGSTKSDVITHAQALLGEKITRFVPGHPIAGAEKSGVIAACADLFDNRNVVLTPTVDTDLQALEKVRQMWQNANAHVSLMTAGEHDSIFATVSHLPHLLAFALVDEIASRPDAAQLFGFAASGFRDFTRIAASDAEMWRDISLANKNALLNELNAYQAKISTLKTMLENEDTAGLQALFERASTARKAWAESKNMG